MIPHPRTIQKLIEELKETKPMRPTPDLNAFAADCHEVSKSKGWLEQERSDAEYANLMVSELSEALEDFRNHKGIDEVYFEGVDPNDDTTMRLTGKKPCGIPIELADFVIRLGQYAGTHELNLADTYARRLEEGPMGREDLMTAMANATFAVMMALAPYPRDHEIRSRKPIAWLAVALAEIDLFCKKNEIDLWHWVEVKQTFNKTRPHKHGGKKI